MPKLNPFEHNPWLEKKSLTQEKAKQLLKHEKGFEEEIWDREKGFFENIRFKETTDRATGEAGYISRHKGRPLVILEGPDVLRGIEIGKPYKAQVTRTSKTGKVIYVQIVE